MHTINFELIAYNEVDCLPRYYWINQLGMKCSPKFSSIIDANEFMKRTIEFFEKRKKGL